MKKLLMLRGLPASGKSTYAKELVAQGWKRVNKDELRLMIDNGKWTRTNEILIVQSEVALVEHFLERGFDVVIDDTNFAYEYKWKQIADSCGADFGIKDFNTPMSVCIERDAKRGDRSVGAKVIERMWRQYIEPKIELPVHDPELLQAYIFDIDGTLAIMGNRSPFEWHKVGKDYLNEDVATILRNLQQQTYEIIILSGRDSVCRQQTMEWLDMHEIKYDQLYMRSEGDSRKDSEVKKELYENHIKGKYNVMGVFDDRDQVVELWRSLGLTCLQVNYGNF